MNVYGLMMALAAGVALALPALGRRRFGLPRRDVFFALLYGLVGFLLGAKALFLLTNLPALLQSAELWLHRPDLLLTGGYTLAGGLAGGGLGAWLYCRQYRIDWWALVNTALPALSLALALARLGCFWRGCCRGVVWPPGVSIGLDTSAPKGAPIFPVQLVEAGCLVLLFLLLLKLAKQKDSGALLCFLACYSALRLLLEPLRADATLWTLLCYLPVLLVSACSLLRRSIHPERSCSHGTKRQPDAVSRSKESAG